MKTIIFARVSTNMQEYDRQVNELTILANSKGWSVEAVFVEKISGAKSNAKRSELLNMVAYVEVNAIDRVLDFICQQTNELHCGNKENGESFLTFSVSVPRAGGRSAQHSHEHLFGADLRSSNKHYYVRATAN